MPPVFQINITGGGGSGSGGSGGSQGGGYAGGNAPSSPKGWFGHLSSGISQVAQGGSAGGLQKQMALMNMGGIGASIGKVAGAAQFGPIGAAFAVMQEVVEATSKAISKMGEVGRQVAGNDYLGLVVKNTGLAGKAIGEFASVVSAFIARGKQLEMYSPGIAGMGAVAEVRGVMADIREANVLGESMGKLIDAQSQFETEFRDMMLPIKESVLKFVSEVMMGAVVLLEEAEKKLAQIYVVGVEGTDILIDIAKWQTTKAAEDYQKMKDHLEQIEKHTKPPDKTDMLQSAALSGLANFANGGAGRDFPMDPMQVRAAQKANNPAFGDF